LAPEVEGRVAAIGVDAGDRVAAGDTLLELNDEFARLKLAQAEALHREAVAELADAERRLEEVRDLSRRTSVADTEVRAREAEVERDRAVVERRRAEEAYEAALLTRHTVKAPFDGVIARRLTDLGEWVGNDTAVFDLVAVDRLRLDLQIPQAYFGRVLPGTPVAIRLDALPDAPLEARVSEVVPVSDASARTFLVRVGLDNGAGHMTPGMSARGRVRMGTGRQGVVVPRDALIRYPDGRVSVWVVTGADENATVSERAVQPGIGFGDGVEILSGLEAGTPVVVRGNETLQEGQAVRVENDG
jgi:RND family efflux transporter MFP subunit